MESYSNGELAQMEQAGKNAERCVCCGAVIPEGRQVCPICELKATAELRAEVRNYAKAAIEEGIKKGNLVEVVRCRDCKYVDKWIDHEGERWYNCCMHDDELTYSFKGDDFCSWGKRRKGNDRRNGNQTN